MCGSDTKVSASVPGQEIRHSTSENANHGAGDRSAFFPWCQLAVMVTIADPGAAPWPLRRSWSCFAFCTRKLATQAFELRRHFSKRSFMSCKQAIALVGLPCRQSWVLHLLHHSQAGDAGGAGRSASWGPFFPNSFLLQEVALADQPSRRSWSCIVFVTRKLATLAVDAVLRAAPGLGFLTAAPFMGYGGDTSAASMDVKVRLKFTIEDFLRKLRRYSGAGVSDGGPSYGLRRRHIRRVNGR